MPALGDRVVGRQQQGQAVRTLDRVGVGAREHGGRVVPDAVAHVLDGRAEADDRASHAGEGSERPKEASAGRLCDLALMRDRNDLKTLPRASASSRLAEMRSLVLLSSYLQTIDEAT